MLKIGKMRHRIEIQAPSTTEDSMGQPTATGWTKVLCTWSEIKVADAKDVFAVGSGFTSQVSHKITTRFNRTVGVTSAMRVVYRGRVFLIQAVSDPDEMQVERDLLCLEQDK